jgi:hypothetical protein
MSHIYASVASVSAGCLYMFAMATHMFSSFSGVLQVYQTYVASVSDVSDVNCKCFIHLDVAKVDRVLHVLQCDPPAATA